jgi:nitrous oxide reductase accessory protein NosL
MGVEVQSNEVPNFNKEKKIMQHSKFVRTGWLPLGLILVFGLALSACQRQEEGQGAESTPSSQAGRPVAQAERPSCPVCGMHADMNPEWMCTIEYKDGSQLQFDVPEHMLAFYVNPGEHKASDHQKDRNNIVRMTVIAYNTKSVIDARTAFYVIGSKVTTPMGKGVIPFKSRGEAEQFQAHQGGRIVAFNEFTLALVKTVQ